MKDFWLFRRAASMFYIHTKRLERNNCISCVLLILWTIRPLTARSQCTPHGVGDSVVLSISGNFRAAKTQTSFLQGQQAASAAPYTINLCCHSITSEGYARIDFSWAHIVSPHRATPIAAGPAESHVHFAVSTIFAASDNPHHQTLQSCPTLSLRRPPKLSRSVEP